MGNFESSMDLDSDYEEYYNMYDEDETDEVSDHYLINIMLDRVVNSLHYRDESSPSFENSRRLRLPNIKAKPNLEKLKANAIYQSIKYNSGYGADHTSPDAKWSLVKMLNDRQRGLGVKHGSLTQPERCKIQNNFLPNNKKSLKKFEAKCFCGCFARDGNIFISASQDSMIRIYDSTTTSYPLINKIMAKDVSWCMLDIAFSPDGENFAYSTWSSCIYLGSIRGTPHQLQPLFLQPSKSSFCIFSLAFSNCGDQIIGGASDGCIYIYDLPLGRRTHKIRIEQESVDVNAVGFIDETSNIFYSGSDSGVLKVWDRRSLNENNPKEVGLFVGHLDGITFVDAKNDARYLLSNSKDQTIKLWDMRVFSKGTAEDQSQQLRRRTRHYNRWDYRWDEIPKEYYSDQSVLPDDSSIMTYRGHRVNKTLIRSRFSPLATTGQRYIYTGCGSGALIIYDVLTGAIVRSIPSHKDIVRDVAWHPKRNEIITSSWDKHLNINTYQSPKRAPYKRFNKDMSGDSAKGIDTTYGGPAPRRSRRIAQRQINNSLGSGSQRNRGFPARRNITGRLENNPTNNIPQRQETRTVNNNNNNNNTIINNNIIINNNNSNSSSSSNTQQPEGSTNSTVGPSSTSSSI